MTHPIPSGPTALSVNLNKVALVRNTRHLGIPSVTRGAQAVLTAGAHGITVHPRPDARHIRLTDVLDLAGLLQDWPGREFNIEGNPGHNLLDVAAAVVQAGGRVDQLTFVPDSQDQFTSDHGWVFPVDALVLRDWVARGHALGARVSLFMDAQPDAMVAARATGADRVELYTEPYAQAWGTPSQATVVARFAQAAQAAQAAGLAVNAGHDLNRANLADFLTTVPGVREVSIGHALIADALELGYGATVEAYLAAIAQAWGQSA